MELEKEFSYNANIVTQSKGVGPPVWMVKRWREDPSNYTESLISVPTDDPKEAIKAAIQRNSWG